MPHKLRIQSQSRTEDTGSKSLRASVGVVSRRLVSIYSARHTWGKEP
jgi:hypothetical protein